MTSDEQQYPGVELAYPIALDSYRVAQNRWEAVDVRIQSLLAVAATVTLATPAVFAAVGIGVRRDWFIAAIVCFVVGASVGG
jgi:hypothetical protein